MLSAEKGLLADMGALLSALEKEENNMANCKNVENSPVECAEVPQSLEVKLEQLLFALRSNDADEWEGKPQQINLDLRDSFCFQESGNKETKNREDGAGTTARDSLNALMREYLTAVDLARQQESPSAS